MTTNQFIKSMLKFSVPTVISALIGILCLPIISRVYPEEQYGYISQYRSVGTLIRGIVLLGLDQAYIRFFHEASENSDRNGMFQFCIKVGVTTFAVVFCASSVFHKNITEYLFNEDNLISFIFLSVYILSMSFFRYQNINYRYLGKPKEYNIQQICYIIGDNLLFVVAAFYSTNYIYSIGVIMIANIVVVGLSAINQKEFYKKGMISKTRKQEMIKYALPVMPVALIVLFNNSMAKLIMGGLGLRADVGVFAIATSAANIFSIIPNAFQVYWGTYIFEYYNKEPDRIKKVHDIVMALSALLVIAIFVFEDILYLFLGVNYRSSEAYFMIIMLMPITNLMLETTSYGINIAKRTSIALISSIVSCAVNVIICWTLIPVIGPAGAAFGIGLSATVGFLIRTIFGQYFYKSIYKIWKTVVTCILIWGICISNLVLVDYLQFRIMIAIIVILIELFIYRNYARELLVLLNNLMTKRHKAL